MTTGSCLCGKLKYEFTGEPVGKATCYCKACQRISGGAYTLNMLVPEDRFRVVSGTPKQYREIHESGMNLTINFCDNCGCAIYKTADRESFKGHAVILVGTLDNPQGIEQAKPGQEFYTKYRPSWLPTFDWAEGKSEF